MINTTNTQPVLKPCPFCACAMRIESNRDWHRIYGAHTEACLFDEDTEQLMVPATPDQFALMVECWNDRASPAHSEDVYQFKAINGDWVEISREQYDTWATEQYRQGNCALRRLTVADGVTESSVLWPWQSPFKHSLGVVAAGETDQNETGMWTAGIDVGDHGSKIEIHDNDRKTAEALRDLVCKALTGKVAPDEAAQEATLPSSNPDNQEGNHHANA